MSFPPLLRRVLTVTTLGSFLAFLDSSVVNVALRPLSEGFDTSLTTIQWVITAYLLALAAVLPVSGWAAARFGAGRMYALSIGAFTLSSLACGLSTSVWELIAFRAVQGAAAAVATPVAQMLAVRAAGPERLAKAMSITGVPTVLAPILGPAVGGLLLAHVGWRWIFLINVPIGVLIVVLAMGLPREEAEETTRFDLPGFALLALGSLGLTYALTALGNTGNVTTSFALPGVAGLVLLAVFVGHALRVRRPLLDLRLYRNGRYAAASLANFCLGAVLFGSIIILPLYFQIVRHRDPVETGLLCIPQSIGVAVAVGLGSKIIGAVGSAWAAFLGGLLNVAATVPFVFLGDRTSFWQLGAAMVVRGFAVGGTIVPTTTAAYQSLPQAAVGDATVQLNVLQRLGGSLSTALFAVILQSELASARTPVAQAAAFGTAFWWVVAVAVCATAPSVLLIVAQRAQRAEGERRSSEETESAVAG